MGNKTSITIIGGRCGKVYIILTVDISRYQDNWCVGNSLLFYIRSLPFFALTGPWVFFPMEFISQALLPSLGSASERQSQSRTVQKMKVE